MHNLKFEVHCSGFTVIEFTVRWGVNCQVT